jgi:hypothetical protein
MPEGCPDYDPMDCPWSGPDETTTERVGVWLDGHPHVMATPDRSATPPPRSPTEASSHDSADADVPPMMLPSPLESAFPASIVKPETSCCACRVCTANNLVDFLGKPCLRTGLQPPAPYFVAESPGGTKH